jgi:crotonobetainyl-CoA:carnitine CoA-transferase CaiB-like acyl-CoA transferase
VPCAPVLTRRELLADPQVAANGLIVEFDQPGLGRIRQARPAARFERTPAEIRRPAPAIGEHTSEILAELGDDEATISATVAALEREAAR